MRTETLKFAATTNQDCADDVTRALQGVKGVSGIEVVLENNEVTVRFDDQLTSSQELQNVLARAGYPASAEKSGCGNNGGCCGGCGGKKELQEV